MMSPAIIVKDLVLIGGGHAHVHTIKMLGMKPMPGVSVTLISKDVESPYSGMIPGFVAGHYTREECHVDLARLCSFGGVNMIHAEVCKIDVDQKLIFCKDGRPPICYDVVSIDVGISPKPLQQAFAENKLNITPVKPIDGFAARWEVILGRVLATKSGDVVKIAIVGGGAGGVELCFAMHHRLQNEMKAIGEDFSQLQISIYNRGKTLMSSHSSQVQTIIRRIASERGITIELNVDVTEVESVRGEEYLVSKDGRKFLFHEAVWCTEAVGQSWVKESGLETTDEGFICVNTNLQSRNSPDVFACGDVAHLVDNPRPKAGVFAVRAGPPLTLNLRNKLLNKALVPWTPQDQFLGIISTGNAYAIASKGALGIEGAFLWELKDKIDRQWMAGYNDLPDKDEMMKKMMELKRKAKELKMVKKAQNVSNLHSDRSGGAGNSGAEEEREKEKEKEKEEGENEDEEDEDEDGISEVAKTMGLETIEMLSHAKMRCGGCGSKVGSSVLSRALKKVKKLLYSRPEVIAGIGGKSGDDAALLLPPLPPFYMVQTIDYFRSFVSDPYLFGQIAANHALSDIYAMNGEPVSALALVVLSYGPEDKVENTLVQMLAGCLHVLRREGCSLVGGHTSEGTECAMGLSVSGIAHPDRVFHKGLKGSKKSIEMLGEGQNPNKIDTLSMTGSNHSHSHTDSTVAELLNTDIPDSMKNLLGESEFNSSSSNDSSSSSSSSGSSSSNGHLGHVLVLTKALGTGTIMAAHMRAKAKGSWVKSAYASMIQSNREAAQILSTYQCSACTDITGFGLMGHLLEMIKFDDDNDESDQSIQHFFDLDDEVAVELSLSSIPLLRGAVDCIKNGVFSSLHPQNIRCSRAVGNIELGKKYHSYPLLYDPQTSGGLLAAVPSHVAADLLLTLHTAGYDSAAMIGKVIRRRNTDELVVLAD